MASFFTREDIHCIPQKDIDEILERHGPDYLDSVIERQEAIVRTHVKQGGHDVVAIFNEQTFKDAIIMDILDQMVSYVLNYSINSRSTDSLDSTMELNRMYEKVRQRLVRIAQGLDPIATPRPERKTDGILGINEGGCTDGFRNF